MGAQTDKDAIRHQILTYLYEHERETPYQSCDAEEIAEALRLSVGVVDPEVRALVLLNLAEVKRAPVGRRYVGVTITRLGLTAVEHPESMTDPGVRHVVYNTIHAHDNTTISALQMAGGASTQTVGSIAQTLDHPRAHELQSLIATLRQTLREDATFPGYAKDEGQRALTVIEGELIKPAHERKLDKIKLFGQQIVTAAAGAATVVTLVEQIVKIATGNA